MAAKKNINKTQFVKSLSKDLSAKEVVKKAKDAGIVISEAYVYTIRSAAGRAKKKSAGSAPAKKAATTAHTTQVHHTAPAAKAVSHASQASHTSHAAPAHKPVSHTTHAAPAHKAAKKSAKKHAKKTAHKAASHTTHTAHKAPAPVHHTSSGASERHFVELVADIGLHRAQGLLTQFRGQVHNIKVG